MIRIVLLACFLCVQFLVDVSALSLNTRFASANACESILRTSLHDAEIEFQKNWARRLERALSDQHRAAIVIQSESHSIPLWDNFIAAANRAVTASKTRTAADPMNIVSIAMDGESLRNCAQHNVQSHHSQVRIRCVDLDGWLQPFGLLEKSKPGSGDNSEGSTGRGVGFGSCPFKVLMMMKPVVLLHAAQAAPAGILHLDLDVVLHKDLLEWVENEKKPDSVLLAAMNANHNRGVNGGAFFFDRASLPLLKLWVENRVDYIDAEFLEQAAINSLLTQDGNFSHHVQLIHPDVLGECSVFGEYATHYNCEQNKTSMMAQQEDWYTQ